MSKKILVLDRETPNLNMFLGNATIICNQCNPYYVEDENANCLPQQQPYYTRQDPWQLNIVWSQKPAGMDVPNNIDESLSGYTSNVYVSAKEFFGYNSISGQTVNTGTTIVNSMGDVIIVPPTEQHSLGIIHYSKNNTEQDFERFFKYDDYIAHTDEDDIEYFEIYIPFILYDRNNYNTIGARFFMDTIDYYINSAAQDAKINKLKYRYLKDENGYNVGKVFVNNKVIIFDDQEIIAALDYKSNRKYTLPIPKVDQIPVDIKCGLNNTSTVPLMSGGTTETVFISYLFEVTENTGMNGMHCNHYGKVTGSTMNSDVSISFSSTDFKFMTSFMDEYINGYVAHKFYIIAQKVENGNQPDPDGWKIIDFTDQIPNHVVGQRIDPENIRGARFILTNDEYEDADKYDIEDFLGELPDEPSTNAEFGDEQPFPGSIKLVRASDLKTMRFMINLPSGEFETTQNPTYTEGKDKKITEVALLDENKDIVVIAKSPNPITRVGTQYVSVKLDF